MKNFRIVLPLIFCGALSLSISGQGKPRTAEQEFEDYDRNFSQVEKVKKAVVKNLPAIKTAAAKVSPKLSKSVPNIAVKTTAPPKNSHPNASVGLPGMKIWFEKQTACAGAFSTIAPNTVFKSGDCVRARFRLNFEGYLTIVNYGSSGSIKKIFPPDDQNNRIFPKTNNFIPDNQGWEFDDAAGNENLFFIVSNKPLNGDVFREIKSRRDVRTESAHDAEVYERDLKPRTEKNEVFVLAGETRLEKPLVFRLTLKHR